MEKKLEGMKSGREGGRNMSGNEKRVEIEMVLLPGAE